MGRWSVGLFPQIERFPLTQLQIEGFSDPCLIDCTDYEILHCQIRVNSIAQCNISAKDDFTQCGFTFTWYCVMCYKKILTSISHYRSHTAAPPAWVIIPKELNGRNIEQKAKPKDVTYFTKEDEVRTTIIFCNALAFSYMVPCLMKPSDSLPGVKTCSIMF